MALNIQVSTQGIDIISAINRKLQTLQYWTITRFHGYMFLHYLTMQMYICFLENKNRCCKCNRCLLVLYRLFLASLHNMLVFSPCVPHIQLQKFCSCLATQVVIGLSVSCSVCKGCRMTSILWQLVSLVLTPHPWILCVLGQNLVLWAFLPSSRVSTPLAVSELTFKLTITYYSVARLEVCGCLVTQVVTRSTSSYAPSKG